MRKRRKLRWIERRNTKAKTWGSSPFEVIDLVMIVLLIGLSFLILRISYIYAVTQLESKSAFHEFGRSFGLGSAFDLGLILSAMLFVFWVIVTLKRLPKLKQSGALIIWHGFMFWGIGLMAYGCYSSVVF